MGRGEARVASVPPAVHQALLNGRKLEAVMLLGHIHNLELADAKAAVDRYLNEQPWLKDEWVHARLQDSHWRAWGCVSLVAAGLLLYLRWVCHF